MHGHQCFGSSHGSGTFCSNPLPRVNVAWIGSAMALWHWPGGAPAAGGPAVDALLHLLPHVAEDKRQTAAAAAMGATPKLHRGQATKEVGQLTSLILAGVLPSGVRTGESDQDKKVNEVKVTQRLDGEEGGKERPSAEKNPREQVMGGSETEEAEELSEEEGLEEADVDKKKLQENPKEVDFGKNMWEDEETETKIKHGNRLDKMTSLERNREEELEIELVDKELDEALDRARGRVDNSSPLKALIQPALDWWRSPKKRRATQPEEEVEDKAVGKGERRERKDAPWLSRATQGAKTARANLRGVLRAAQRLRERRNKKLPIEDLFEANSSKNATASRRKTVKKIMEALEVNFPLSARTLMEIASALKIAGYKAGVNYLADCKIWHVEEGHAWSELMDRTFKKCKRGLERGKGPRKKAPEVPGAVRERAREDRNNNKKVKIFFARELFEFGMCWMLREAELAILSTTNVRADHILKRVRLKIPVSKKDQEGEGVQRVLQCLCGEGRCKPNCPYEVAQDLLDKLQRRSVGASKLCVAKHGKLATKARLVASWKAVFQQPVPGHSARRTGALEYIRAGWSVGQVAHLGRWKSGVILQYAEEALASMPANVVQHGGQVGHHEAMEGASTLEVARLKEWKEALTEEVNLLKVKVKDASEENKEKRELWKKLAREAQGRLPLKVQSCRQQVVHLNLARSVASPPIGWRTACGWSFYGNNFVFVDNEAEVTCDKCKGFCAESQRGGC